MRRIALVGMVLGLAVTAAAFCSLVLSRLVILVDRLAGWKREAVEPLNLFAALVLCSILVFRSWGLFAESWHYTGTSILLETPLANPQGAMLLGVLSLWGAFAVCLGAGIAARSRSRRSVPGEGR